jgi:hypothetical protein
MRRKAIITGGLTASLLVVWLVALAVEAVREASDRTT